MEKEVIPYLFKKQSKTKMVFKYYEDHFCFIIY